MGYQRPDGGIGIRNKIAIISSVECSAVVAKKIAEKVPGAVAITHTGGCAQLGMDFQVTASTLVNLALNPNVYASLVVGLGCENMTSEMIRNRIEKTSSKPVESFDIQDVHGGTPGSVEKGAAIASQWAAEMAELEREPFDASQLVLGIKCGGSDGLSGVSSNPAVGIVSDRVVSAGGTSIMPEFTEWIGGEHLLAKRAVTPDVGERILGSINAFISEMLNRGLDFRVTQPTLGNKKGGLSTIEEKALGTIAKTGKSPIQGLFLYSERVPDPHGMWLLFEPGHDIEAMTGLAAAGAQAIIFTTGRGSPCGNILCPVIKVCANPITAEFMQENLDVDASGVVKGTQTVDELGDVIWERLLATINGEQTRAEILGHDEMAIWRGPDLTLSSFEALAKQP